MICNTITPSSHPQKPQDNIALRPVIGEFLVSCVLVLLCCSAAVPRTCPGREDSSGWSTHSCFFFPYFIIASATDANSAILYRYYSAEVFSFFQPPATPKVRYYVLPGTRYKVTGNNFRNHDIICTRYPFLFWYDMYEQMWRQLKPSIWCIKVRSPYLCVLVSLPVLLFCDHRACMSLS